MLAVTDLVATLGGLLALGVESRGAEVDDLTIAEPGQGVVGQPGDLVLGVGVEAARGRAVELVSSARRQPVPAAWCCGAHRPPASGARPGPP